MKELGITKGEVKPEFTIEQIRAFVAKNYNSVSARYVKSALQHYDEAVRQRDELRERCKQLEFMIEKGLGWDDVKNDISMSHEL